MQCQSVFSLLCNRPSLDDANENAESVTHGRNEHAFQGINFHRKTNRQQTYESLRANADDAVTSQGKPEKHRIWAIGGGWTTKHGAWTHSSASPVREPKSQHDAMRHMMRLHFHAFSRCPGGSFFFRLEKATDCFPFSRPSVLPSLAAFRFIAHAEEASA